MIPNPVSAPVESTPVRPTQKTTSSESQATPDGAFQDAYDKTDEDPAFIQNADETTAAEAEAPSEGTEPSAAQPEGKTVEADSQIDLAEIATPLTDADGLPEEVRAETDPGLSAQIGSETAAVEEPSAGADVVGDEVLVVPVAGRMSGQAESRPTDAKGPAVATVHPLGATGNPGRAAADPEAEVVLRHADEMARAAPVAAQAQVAKVAAPVIPAQSLFKQAQNQSEELSGDRQLTEEVPTDVTLKSTDTTSGALAVKDNTVAKPVVHWVSPAEVSIAMRAVQDGQEFRLGGQDASQDEVEERLQLVASNTTGPTATSVLAGTTRAEGALISGQIAASVQRNGPGQFELALNPPELGRLKITLESRDGGIVVSISADRQETMDLIRRHVDQLERDFLEMGYQNASFSFGEQGDPGEAGEDGGGASGGAVLTEAVEGDASIMQSDTGAELSAAGHIDIRV